MDQINKITEQELKELKELNDKYNLTMASLGEQEAMLSDLQDQMDKLREDKKGLLSDYNTLKEKSQFLTKSLADKYGPGSVNLETGEIKPL